MFPACCVSDHGAKVNAMNCCGATAMHDAMFRGGGRDVLEELSHSGANPLIQATKGCVL
jgi:ankyrin repeat protein